jgi:predicted RNA-binding protein YlxR (DUF448 family)
MGPEQAIMNGIIQYLSIKGYLVFRMNSGAMKLEKRFLRFGYPGMADLLMVHQGRAIWIEVKDLKGKQSMLQHLFQRDVEKAGCYYMLATSIEDVMNLEKLL